MGQRGYWMSDNFLRLIPADPVYVPGATAREAARKLLASFVPQADAVVVEVTDEVSFIDQGSNFERVICPVCGTELDVRWWQSAMDKAYEKRFSDLVVNTPCCSAESSLNDLDYQWPAGFSQFMLEARNPNGDLDDRQRGELEAILGCAVRKIWAHY